MTETKQVIDGARVGTKGFPRYYEALGFDPPMKTVPVDDPQTSNPPTQPIDPNAPLAAADLTAYAANARWVKETSGITVVGVAIATDDRSKQMIMGARIAADADGNFTTQWVASDGSISTLTAPQIIAISDAVLAHVAACFAKYADVKSQIDAGTITTPAQIDAAFGAV